MKVLCTFETSETAHLTTRQTAEDANPLSMYYLFWGGRGYCHVIICFVGHLIDPPLSYVKPLYPFRISPATVVFHSTCIAHRVLSSLNLRNADL